MRQQLVNVPGPVRGQLGEHAPWVSGNLYFFEHGVHDLNHTGFGGGSTPERIE